MGSGHKVWDISKRHRKGPRSNAELHSDPFPIGFFISENTTDHSQGNVPVRVYYEPNSANENPPGLATTRYPVRLIKLPCKMFLIPCYGSGNSLFLISQGNTSYLFAIITENRVKITGISGKQPKIKEIPCKFPVNQGKASKGTG